MSFKFISIHLFLIFLSYVVFKYFYLNINTFDYTLDNIRYELI